jgi:hypothetical protein
MKRRALAVCAGLLLLGLMPGSALATSGVLDQSNPSTDTTCSERSSSDLAQTFTADKSGTLTEVDLWMSWEGTGTATVTASIENTGSGAPVGPALATATATVTSTPAWVQFFPTPLVTITSGTAYAIVFNTGSDVHICNAAGHTGAQAWDNDGGWLYYSGEGHSFAYQTFLAAATAETVTTTLAWDKSQVTAGTGTALKLTATIVFVNGTEALGYTVLLGALPSWYVNPTPPTIVCSWGACDLATIQGVAGIAVPPSGTGTTLTVTLQGTATPAAADVGTPGAAHGNGCILSAVADVLPGAQPAQTETSLCSDSTASVQVVAAAAPTPTPTATPSQSVLAVTAAPVRTNTPPPTSTGVGSASDNTGGTIWFLPFALVVFFGGLLVLVDRRRRRLI